MNHQNHHQISCFCCPDNQVSQKPFLGTYVVETNSQLQSFLFYKISDRIRWIRLKQTFLNIQNHIKPPGSVEPKTFSILYLSTLHFLLRKQYPMRKGKLKFIPIEIYRITSQNRMKLISFNSANSFHHIFHSIFFQLQLLGIIKILPLASTAMVKMPAWRINAIRRRLQDIFDLSRPHSFSSPEQPCFDLISGNRSFHHKNFPLFRSAYRHSFLSYIDGCALYNFALFASLLHHLNYLIVISVRRFFWRPSGVSLVATGSAAPFPMASIRELSIPFFTKYSLTASARFWDKLRLSSSCPTLSVCPVSRIVNSILFFKNSVS